MRKWTFGIGLTLLLSSTFASSATAATINNAAAYLPTSGYKYYMYDRQGEQQKQWVIYSGKGNERQIKKSSSQGFTQNVYDGYYSMFFGYSDIYIFAPVKFPVTAGKTYKQTLDLGYDTLNYKYTIVSVNGRKKVKNKTYKNVIRVRYSNGDQLYLAKGHGAILLTIYDKKRAKHIVDFKVYNVKN